MLASPPCIVPGLVRGLIERGQHKKICKLLNGAWRYAGAVSSPYELVYTFEGNLRRRTPQSEDMKRFFKLFD
jgi:hypothetical protein